MAEMGVPNSFVDRRQSDRRSRDFRELANSKQTTLSGGDVSYYLQELQDGTVVELDDINMVLAISFFEATSFKSLHRLCKLRTGLGKPGSTPEYEAGKVLYYNKLTNTQSVRLSMQGLIVTGIDDICDYIVDVPDPKRLDPYSFRIGDYIDSLNPSAIERTIFEHLFTVIVSRFNDTTVSYQALESSKKNIACAQELVAAVEQGVYAQ